MLFRLASVAALAAAPLLAQGPAAGPEFQVNTYTTSYQSAPTVAGDSAGNFVVVWESYMQDGSLSSLWGQRYDSLGAPQGGEFQVNSYTTNYQFHPTVASDSAGNFVVVWASTYQDLSLASLWGQRYNSLGAPQGGEFQVNSYSGYQVSPKASMDAAGNFAVVWEDFEQDGSSYGVFGRRFDSQGTPQGLEFQVNSYTTGNQDTPSLAVQGAESFVVVWESDLQDGSYEGVFGQRFALEIFADGFESGDTSAWSSQVPPP